MSIYKLPSVHLNTEFASLDPAEKNQNMKPQQAVNCLENVDCTFLWTLACMMNVCRAMPRHAEMCSEPWLAK